MSKEGIPLYKSGALLCRLLQSFFLVLTTLSILDLVLWPLLLILSFFDCQPGIEGVVRSIHLAAHSGASRRYLTRCAGLACTRVD